MANTKRAFLSAWVVSACIIADQLSKALAAVMLEPHISAELFGHWVRFEYTENKGIFLGWGWQLPDEIRFWFFTVISGVLLIGILCFMLREPGLSARFTVALSAIAGGGIGNTLDRLLREGLVIDFIGLHTVIINLADVTISVGMGLLVISWLRLLHCRVRSFPKAMP
jgi:signal peptidase II